MTEYMLNWIMAVCPNHDFAIDESVRAMYEKMLSVEQSNYEIKLKLHDQNLIIENAAPGLLQYIDSLGGLTLDNLLRLVDASNVLGYTVDQTLVDELKKLHSTNFEFIVNRRTSCSKDKMSMDDILEYARQVNRLPIHVYENGLPKTNTEEIIYLNRGFGPEICPKLLVTTTSLMIGSKKQSWVTNAEKIIIIE
jgi:uncharacterized protein (DUF342 family)